jgi:hypothetical protein
MNRTQRLRLTFLAAASAAALFAAAAAILLLDSASGGAFGPRIGDHWHAPYAVIVCEQLQPPVAEFAHSSGIHTHGDGVLHLHPQTTEGEGDGASIAHFFKNSGGWVDFSFAPEGCAIEYREPLVLRADSGIHPLGADFSAAIEMCNSIAEGDFGPVSQGYVPLDGDCIRIIFANSRS